MLGSTTPPGDTLSQLVVLLSNPELLEKRKKELEDVRAGVDKSIEAESVVRTEVAKRKKEAEAQETANNMERDRLAKLDSDLNQQRADFSAFKEQELATLRDQKQAHRNEVLVYQEKMDAHADQLLTAQNEHEANKAALEKHIKAHSAAMSKDYESIKGRIADLDKREAFLDDREEDLNQKHLELDKALAVHTERVKKIRSIWDQMTLALNQ